MRNSGLWVGSKGALVFGLLLVPACGGQGLRASRDATLGADAAPADQAPTPTEDLAPLAPDLLLPPDLPPDVPFQNPDCGCYDRDVPVERNVLDLPQVDVRDVPPSEYLKIDEPPPDQRADQAPIMDLAPNLDQAPAYDLADIPDEPPDKPDIYISPDARGLDERCTSSGGAIETQSCCPTVGDYRDMCITTAGGCGCAPASSRSVYSCVCPQPSCFMPAYGCVGPGATCTVGADQTCNDNPVISSTHGRCVENGRCVCGGFGMSTASGKCL